MLALALSLATLLPHSAGPYVALMLIGFAAGIVLIFLGAFLFPLALNLTESTPPQLKNR